MCETRTSRCLWLMFAAGFVSCFVGVICTSSSNQSTSNAGGIFAILGIIGMVGSICAGLCRTIQKLDPNVGEYLPLLIMPVRPIIPLAVITSEGPQNVRPSSQK